MTWDATEYARVAPNIAIPERHIEEQLLHDFPPLIPADQVIGRTEPLPVVREPCVFVDKYDRMLVVSLPGVLSPHRQVS